MKRSLLILIFPVILMSSCGLIKKTASPSSEFENYQEDLDDSRIVYPDLEEQIAKEETTPKYEGDVGTADADLEIALNNLKESNKAEMYWSGYTVLVYSGIDRDLAFKTRNDLFTFFPDFKTDMQYQQPRYLVKVGKFVNRIEALTYYHQLKENFPSSRIIQDRFLRDGYVIPEPVTDGQQQN
jgi:hypothetical protein